MTFKTTTLGVISLLDPLAGADLIRSARAIEAMGYGSLWLPEVLGREAMATAGVLLANTAKLSIATGIANVYVRDAHATVHARHTLCELFGERFILGLGVSNVEMSRIRGYPWQPPLKKLTTYLDQMDTVQPQMKTAAALGPLHIAAHGPHLQALAAARCDGAMTYLMSPAHTARSRERIGAHTELSVSCMMLADDNAERARSVGRKALSYYLTLDYYHREWRELGFSDADFRDGGSDALIDMLLGWGDEAALRQRVQEHLDAGATRVLLMPLDIARDGLVNSTTLSLLAPSA